VKQGRGKISDARAELARRNAEEPGGVPRYETRQARLAAVARRERTKAERVAGPGWCILRTSGPKTLPLAASLAGAGYEVWTPAETRMRRAVRGRRALTQHEAPIAPSFVFVRADRLYDLARILALPLSPHPSFSIFHHAGRVPVVADHEIAGLRNEEERARHVWEKAERAKAKPPTFNPDDAVRVDQSAFVGLVGKVEEQRGRKVMVQLGAMRMQVTAWHILPDAVQADQPVEGAAA
jgi:transcription antitermination factor NusG